MKMSRIMSLFALSILGLALAAPASAQEPSKEGLRVPAGQKQKIRGVILKRDPDNFIRPECFDVRRRPNEHVAFGDGIHSCVGAQLARLQGKIAIGAILARFPEFRLRDPHSPLLYSGSLLSRGLSSLHMVVS